MPFAQAAIDETVDARAGLGRSLFSDRSLSADGNVSCQTCHAPAKKYTDSRSTSLGIDGKAGTRNAPSLIGIANDTAFFWDGRRTRLEDAVTDAFTNPIELGLPSTDELIRRLEQNPQSIDRFRRAFPKESRVPTLEQVRAALSSFVRSLTTAAKPVASSKPASAEVLLGKRLFDGVAGCAECHASKTEPDRFSDGAYHHSSVSPPSLTGNLPALTRAVIEQSPGVDAIGPKVLADPQWSALGRFVVTQRPTDIAAFRTPSLRNVALTAPYMHDGSIATLQQAVDHELFYRSFARGHPVNLSMPERKALVAYLETLTDAD